MFLSLFRDQTEIGPVAGDLPGSEKNCKAHGIRARLDTHEGYAGQFHVFHDMDAGVCVWKWGWGYPRASLESRS